LQASPREAIDHQETALWRGFFVFTSLKGGCYCGWQEWRKNESVPHIARLSLIITMINKERWHAD